MEKNLASECIRIVAATYGCKILHICEHDPNVYGYDAKLRMAIQEYQLMQHKGQLINEMRSFCKV